MDLIPGNRMEMDQEIEKGYAAILKVILAIDELHRRGYELLRLAPGMSPSGCYWRCSIAPKSNISAENGAMLADFDGIAAHGSIGGDGKGGYDGIEISQYSTPSELADALVERFPDVMKSSRGSDPEYVEWYKKLLTYADRGMMPVAYADWYHEPDPRYLPFWNGESDLPMPPPGAAPAK